jgi:hypothetical protein
MVEWLSGYFDFEYHAPLVLFTPPQISSKKMEYFITSYLKSGTRTFASVFGVMLSGRTPVHSLRFGKAEHPTVKALETSNVSND